MSIVTIVNKVFPNLMSEGTVVMDTYNRDYDGMRVEYNDVNLTLRTGRKTPTKSGYFSVLWTKDADNTNKPYASLPGPLVILLSDEQHEGMFVFPVEALIKHGILTSDKHKGKMGFRVYTPWDTGLNKTAQKTFSWQKDYFIDTNQDDAQDILLLLHQIGL